MSKPTFVVFIAVLTTLFQVFYPVLSAPMDRGIPELLQPPQPLAQPSIECDETNERCDICDDMKFSDICYFNCKPSTNHPKGHLFCDNCVLKTYAVLQTCPFCRAELINAKVDQLLLKNATLALTFFLEKLKYHDLDLTKPSNQLATIIDLNQIKPKFEILTKLLFIGASCYSETIKPILFKMIHLVQFIQINSKKLEIDLDIIHIKRAIIYEYFKNGHYKVVKEIILQSIMEDDKRYFIFPLIGISYQYKNTSVLYDYMKNIASQHEKEYFIYVVIRQATDTCFLDGLLELIHTILRLQSELRDLVFRMSFIKFLETRDFKCCLESTNDYHKYLTKKEIVDLVES